MESQRKYQYSGIKLITPPFDSPLTDLIIELDHLRKKELSGSTPPWIFFQLKSLFHLLESLESARIEGNRTTLAEIVDQKIETEVSDDEKIKEITNVESALAFIDKVISEHPINRALLSEIHKLVVKDLPATGEGDPTPGEYRRTKVTIAKAKHIPPEYVHVDELMEELFSFINEKTPQKYDLMKVALAHHRFVWIHPYRNGNGRTVRLMTYAMLVKLGFNVKQGGRILNPTAIFCNNRDIYYQNLSKADTGEEKELLNWCEYVLAGLNVEMGKIDRLLDYSFLAKEILLPALSISLERKIITQLEYQILSIAVEKRLFDAGDLRPLFQGKAASEISRTIRSLKEKKMVLPEGPNKRKYFISFRNNYLMRGVIKKLWDSDFIPFNENT